MSAVKMYTQNKRELMLRSW